MDVKQLQQLAQQGWRPVVTFSRDIVNCECYAEPGMKARLDCVRTANMDDAVTLVFDYSEFDQHNRSLESSLYYDGNGVACLTAREAGFYNVIETIYAGLADDVSYYFVADDEQSVGLFQEYSKQAVEVPYVTWLEQQLIKARS